MLYCFDDFELDEQLYQLRRAGKLVESSPEFLMSSLTCSSIMTASCLKMNCSEALARPGRY